MFPLEEVSGNWGAGNTVIAIPLEPARTDSVLHGREKNSPWIFPGVGSELMVDATDIKAHPTASSLNKGGYTPPDWLDQGGMASQLHGVCDSKGGPLRLHRSEGQCRDFTGADGVGKDLPPAATVMGDQG